MKLPERSTPPLLLTECAHTVIDPALDRITAQNNVIARLVNVGGGDALNIHEGDTQRQIGRSKELPTPFSLSGEVTNLHLSLVHCELFLSPSTWGIEIVDTSFNGTFLNGTRLQKGSRVPLQHGDIISLLNPAAGNLTKEEKKQCEFVFQRVRPLKGGISTIAEELTCAICSSLMTNPCVVLPCLHCYCGCCISLWLAGDSTCPECRDSVTEARPIAKLNNLVELLLVQSPELARPAAELEEYENRISSARSSKKRWREDSFPRGDSNDDGRPNERNPDRVSPVVDSDNDSSDSDSG